MPGDGQLTAVIVAGGSSRRMGFDKILTPLAGTPLLAHTLHAFELCAEVVSIVVVASVERAGEVRSLLAGRPKVPTLVTGGAERRDSVLHGLAAVATEFVAVHDAARPLVTPAMISRCFAAAREHGAATVAERVTDTLQRSNEEGRCVEWVDRENLWRIQTPQIFRSAELLRACEAARDAGLPVTDETSAFRHQGGEIFLVENSDWNLKVTVPRDVAMAEFVLQSRAAASLT